MNRRSDESRDCASHCTPASAHGRALSIFRNLVHRTTSETELRPGFVSSGPEDELLHAPGPYFLCGMLMIVKVFN